VDFVFPVPVVAMSDGEPVPLVNVYGTDTNPPGPVGTGPLELDAVGPLEPEAEAEPPAPV
jgi:hypothetical protein